MDGRTWSRRKKTLEVLMDSIAIKSVLLIYGMQVSCIALFFCLDVLDAGHCSDKKKEAILNLIPFYFLMPIYFILRAEWVKIKDHFSNLS
jgi:hypothetical protein